MKLRRTWRRVSAWAVILGAVVAVLTTPGIFPSAFEPPTEAIPAPGSADLATSVVAWQQATEEEQRAYLTWLTSAGLRARHAAVTAWIEARARQRQAVTGDLLGRIFLGLALLSLLTALSPLFIKAKRAPRRGPLWRHALLGAGILFFTFLFLSAGLRFLVEVTSDVTQLANPEAGLVDAAFDRIEAEADALLDGGSDDDRLPYGPVVGGGAEEYDGGFLANLWRNLQYFDPSAFEPAIAWSHRAWALLSLTPYVIPFLIAIVFLLTMRPTLARLVRMPLRAGRGEPRSGRRAIAEALGFVAREWIAIIVLTVTLILVALGLHIGVRQVSHAIVRLALESTRTTVEYFGHLTAPPEQPRFTLAILALPAFLLLTTLLTATALGLFALWARRVTQLRFHQGIPLRSHDGFWRRGLVALLQVQWIPVLLVWLLLGPLASLHAPSAGSAQEALDRLSTTGLLLWGGVLVAFPLFGGVRGLWYLVTFRPNSAGEREVAYALRPSTAEDHPFLRRAHHEGLRPWITAVWGWDEARQDQLMDSWLERHQPDIVTIRGRDAGYLLVRDDEDAISLLAVVLLPRHQRRGVGTRLVQGVIDRATEQGKPVVLGVLRPNPAKRLYERLGFEVTEATPERFRMRRPCDDVRG